MSNHSKAPWGLDRGKQALWLVDAENVVIARFVLAGDEDEATEQKANSQLIATAPELLEFVKAVVKEQSEHGDNGDAVLIRTGEALIRKVTTNE